MTDKLFPGATLPVFTLPALNADDTAGEIRIGGPDSRWRVLFVYRGLHCGVCKSYFTRLEALRPDFEAEGVELQAVSADTRDEAASFVEATGLSIPVGHAMTVDQMKRLGLYISPAFVNTDAVHPFPEPGLFVVDPEGRAHMIDIASAPFMRPDPDLVLRGVRMAKNDGYPVRGTLA